MSKLNQISYDENIYTKIPMEDLILLGIYIILKKREVCTFERLVAECFFKFPKVFTFKRYPQWPDSLKFDRPIRKLREKGLIVGGIKDYISLTQFGEKIAKQIKNNLERKVILEQNRKLSRGRSVDDRLIAYLKDTPQYKAFLKEPDNFLISEPEFRNLLRCTLETPPTVVKQNLEYYKNLARLYNEKSLLSFLSYCENKLYKKGVKNGKRT